MGNNNQNMVTKTTPAADAMQVPLDVHFIGDIDNPSIYVLMFELRIKATQTQVAWKHIYSDTTTNFDFSTDASGPYGPSGAWPITLLSGVEYQWNVYWPGSETFETDPFTFTAYADLTIEGVRIGYVDNKDHTNFPQYLVIKQDVSDDGFTTVDLKSTNEGTARATVDVEFDFLTPTIVTSIKDKLCNTKRQLLFMKWPSGADQFLDYRTITTGSTTNVVKYGSSNSTNMAYGGTELTTNEYNSIADFPTATYAEFKTTLSATYNYSYIFFKLQPTFDFDNIVQRITLGIYQPACYFGTATTGFIIEVYDRINDVWLEISRTDWTMPFYAITDTGFNPESHVHYASIRAKAGFTKITNYVDTSSSNDMYFRMRNSIPRLTGSTLYMGIGYTFLMIDGWPVTYPKGTAYNFRDSFTGTGYTGSLSLVEV